MNDDWQERADDLAEIKEQVHELIQTARELVRGADDLTRRRAESGWIAQIEMALDHDHEWLGRASVTMQETIDEMQDAAVEDAP